MPLWYMVRRVDAEHLYIRPRSGIPLFSRRNRLWTDRTAWKYTDHINPECNGRNSVLNRVLPNRGLDGQLTP